MISSDAVAFTFKGKPATMRVFRNNGFCWGRLNVGKREYDVNPYRDYYNHDDASAIEAFIRAARRGTTATPNGWRGC